MSYKASIFDFGAVAGDSGGANAATNDAAFVAAMASTSRVIELSPDVFEISQTIIHNAPKHFIGIDGADCFGVSSWGTRLKWCGSVAGEMYKVRPQTTGVDLIAPAMNGVQFDGNNRAGRAITVRSSRRMVMSGIGVINMEPSASTIAVYLAGGGTGADQGDVNCAYRGQYDRISVAVSGGATALMLDGGLGAGILGNACFNTINDLHITHQNGVGLYMRGCDDNHFYNVAMSRMSGGTGIAVLMDGEQYYCVGNAIHGLQCGAHPAGAETVVYSRGTKARQNSILFLSGVDNRPIVSVVNGSELFYHFVGSGYTPTLAAERPLSRMPKRQELSY